MSSPKRPYRNVNTSPTRYKQAWSEYCATKGKTLRISPNGRFSCGKHKLQKSRVGRKPSEYNLFLQRKIAELAPVISDPVKRFAAAVAEWRKLSPSKKHGKSPYKKTGKPRGRPRKSAKKSPKKASKKKTSVRRMKFFF